MNRTETMRSLFHDLWRARPFRPFAVNMENGDRLIVEHPENCAFDFREQGQLDFVLRTSKIRYFGTFAVVTNLAVLDVPEMAV